MRRSATRNIYLCHKTKKTKACHIDNKGHRDNNVRHIDKKCECEACVVQAQTSLVGSLWSHQSWSAVLKYHLHEFCQLACICHKIVPGHPESPARFETSRGEPWFQADIVLHETRARSGGAALTIYDYDLYDLIHRIARWRLQMAAATVQIASAGIFSHHRARASHTPHHVSLTRSSSDGS
jgi:hypothetical protein